MTAPAREAADSSPADTPSAKNAPNQSAEQPGSGQEETVGTVQTAEQAAPVIDKPAAVEIGAAAEPAGDVEEQTSSKERPVPTEPADQANETVIEQSAAAVTDIEAQPELPVPGDEILDEAEPNLELEETETETETDEAKDFDDPEVEEPEPEDKAEDEAKDEDEPEDEAEAADELKEGGETEETDFIAQAFDDSPEEPVLFRPDVITPPADLSFEITSEEAGKAILAADESINTALAELMEPLEPEAADAIPELIDQIIEIAVKPGDAAETPEDERQQLEQVCRQLLETIGLSDNEELVSKFIDGIDIGTHERKLMNYLIVRNLSLLASVHAPPQVILGRYALGASLFENSPQTLAV